MTPLRLRMINDMQIRNLSPHTQDSYLLQVFAVRPPFCEVAGFAWAGRCPRLPSLSDRSLWTPTKIGRGS